MNKFDLNIEKILEDWEMHHAIREIIANALDEQLLTKTKDVEIVKNSNAWIIRDFGRGLKYSHLTQNENQEKLNNTNVIGKFGIGLKDALATFDRRGAVVTAKSKHGQISIEKSPKQGFGDISTLHAIIEAPITKNFVGTEFELRGVTDEEIESAKHLFLKFSGEEVIETTRHGQVVKRNENQGNIYINGVKVAEEEKFLFSYNITKLSAPIKKALNRERSNVGRSAYTDSVKKILLSSKEQGVAEILAKDLMNITEGTAHDELTWIDVQEHSVKILNQKGKYLFITSIEAMQHPDMIDQAKNSGHEVITIPENLKDKIQGQTDITGNPMSLLQNARHSCGYR
jgi:Histidine kinase-, DNA gyrase B-, and HSP90-like ATPase